MRSSFQFPGRLALLLAASSAVMVAQGVQTGDMAGVVRTKDGAPIAGATVRLEAGRGARVATTNAKGEYRLALLLVGPCKLTVSANGYIGASASASVNLGRTNTVDFSLRPVGKEASATVEVVATSSVETTAVTDGKNTTLDFVDALPINNRTIQNIASLTPGTSNDGTGLTVRGAQGTQTQYLVDGVDVMDPVTGGAAIFMNEDMIQEIQVVTGGASADLGRFTGGMVNTVTKSGTNEFEGVARWEMTNPKWNALNPLEKEAPAGVSTTQNYRISGPIWKDRLFFVVGYRAISPVNKVARYTTAPAAYGGNRQYFSTLTDERKDIKVDFQITPDHRVSYQYNDVKRNRTGIDYSNSFFGGSTGPETLSAQPDTFSYNSFGYVGSLTSNLILTFRYGKKDESLGGPGGGGQGGPTTPVMIDNDTQYVYDNGIFGFDSDKRPVENGTLNATWFTGSPFGDHELKVGADWFQSSRQSSNSQSPNNQYMYFSGWTVDPTAGGSLGLNNRVFDGNSYMQQWEPFMGAETKNTVLSFFVNDKVKFNKHFSANIGLRYDKFKSENDLKANNFDIDALAPRLTGIYDVKGDGSWVVEASYDEYAGQIIQGATDGASVVGNPALRMYSYVAGPGNLRSSYSNTPFYTYDPALYRASNLIDPEMKSPMVKEISVVVRHDDGKGGSYSLALSKRTWDNFATTFTDLNSNPVDVNDQTVNFITNDPSIERDYIGLEFQWQKQINANFGWGGNVTWSETKGNFEGGQVGISGSLNAYGPFGKYPRVNTTPTLAANAYQPTRAQLSPYGYLAADRPLSAVTWANYQMTVFGKGKLNLGLFASFTSGAPYANTATQQLTNYPDAAPGAFGSTYTRFFTPRGAMRFPNQYNVSFQAGYDHKVWKRVTAFGRVNISNLFNHQLQTSWNTTGSSRYLATVADPYFASSTAPGQTSGYQPDNFNRPNAIFMPSSSYGKATSATAHYLAARAINLAFGIRF